MVVFKAYKRSKLRFVLRKVKIGHSQLSGLAHQTARSGQIHKQVSKNRDFYLILNLVANDSNSFMYLSKIVLGKMLTSEDKGNYFLKPYLRAEFAWYLELKEENKIFIDGEELDYSSVIAENDSFPIELKLKKPEFKL